MQGLRVLVLGSTGGVGAKVVETLVRDPRVSSVVAVTRSEKPLSHWNLPDGTSKLEQRVVPNFDHLSEYGDDRIDLGGDRAAQASSESHTLPDASQVKSAISCDAMISCLGLYTADAKDEDHFMKVEVGYNSVAAQMAKNGGAKSHAFLSGKGAVHPDEVGFFTPLFARVKGRAEEKLRSILPLGNSVRPGAIFGRDNNTGLTKIMTTLLFFLENTEHYGIHAQDIAKGMIEVAVISPEAHTRPLENADIRMWAKKYDDGLSSSHSGEE